MWPDRGWSDTYWRQLQHMSAAASALSQHHMASVSNQQQQMAALSQYQLHVQAAVQVGKTASDTLPFIGGAPTASVRPPPLH